MAFRWEYAKPEREETVPLIQKELGIPQKIAYLLSLRGIDSYDKAEIFFRPRLNQIHDPFLMKDMERAAKRLAAAIRRGEKIVVYGDYDVDGTTATSILYLFLKEFGVNVDYYIPHRFKEGYGINIEGIEYAERLNAGLIVSVDCGITAIEEAAIAGSKGIDLIICDHHNTGDEIPEAAAVLNPKRKDCSYPFEGLSGAGVGFKLVQGTIRRLGLDDELAYRFLDLVAISIASDIVPIIDENRVLMREGLRRLNSEPRIGIRALMEHIEMDIGSLTTSNIVFSIGPRINAAGRMGDASKAVKMLIAENRAEASRCARELENINKRRRLKDTQTLEEAVAMLDAGFNLEKSSSMVLHHPDWHLGVIGIVASRLVDTYCRPAIMLSTVDGKIKGSARSVKGFNIYEALKECEDLLVRFGGHEFAAGLTIEKENLEPFRKRLDTIAAGNLSDEDFKPELRVDCDLDLSEVDMKFWKLLSQFEPFGPGNDRPTFVSRNVRVKGVPTIVGKGHLKMKVAQNGSGVFDVIGFNMHEYLPVIRKSGDRSLNIAYSLEENYWNGRRTLQIRLRDLQVRKTREKTG